MMNSTDYIDDYNASSDCSSSSSSPSPSQLALVNALTLWLEGHVTTAVGLVGLVANCVAVPVLRSPNLSSVFNHLLVARVRCTDGQFATGAAREPMRPRRQVRRCRIRMKMLVLARRCGQRASSAPSCGPLLRSVSAPWLKC